MARQYLKKGSTLVNSNKVVAKGDTYLVEDIRQVSVKTTRPGLTQPVVLAILTAGVLFMEYSLLVATLEKDEVAFGMLVGNVLLSIIAVAFVLATLSGFKYRTPVFVLVVEAKDGLSELMENEDEKPVREFQEAIEKALAERDGG